MHELSIALSLLDVAEDEARRRGLTTVTGLHVRLGPLSGVVKDALLSAFELARETSSMPGATLTIEDVPIRASCSTCGCVVDVESAQMLCCAACGTPTPDVVAGRELDLIALETT